MPDESGDPACWLDSVCDACGGIIAEREPHECRAPADVRPTAAPPSPPRGPK